MRDCNIPLTRRFLKEEKGQTAAIVIVVIFALLALSAVGIEAGHVYYAYRLLQASTNAAALAAGQMMPAIGTTSSPSQGTAYYGLYQYSSATEGGVTGLNSSNMLKSASISATFNCSTTATDLDSFCEVPTSGSCSGSATSCNEVTATQTASVPLWFGGLLGIRTISITTVAQAAMGGGHPPYNIAVIIDTTESMTGTASSNDNCPSTSNTQIGCAVYGVEQMLTEMYPCIGSGTCGSSNYSDSVALYVFPPVEVTSTTNYSSDDTTCPTSDPPIVPYDFEDLTTTTSTTNTALPTATSTYGSGAAGTYQIASFENTYKTTDTGSLVTTDGLVIAVGGSGKTTCTGLQAPGGEGTYYAQVIQQAQAALVAQQSYMKSKYGIPTQNILIILSDGDATACNAQASTGNDCNTGLLGLGTSNSQIVAANCPSISSYNASTKTYTCGSATISGGGGTLSCPSGGCSGLPLNGTGSSSTNPAGTLSNGTCYGYNCPAYPSAVGECGQAVWAAQQATAAGTTVYTVAMGSETSGSCTTDSTYSLSNLSDGAATWSGSGSQACTAIAAMASTASTFYSDNSGGCAAISTENKTFESMAAIFQDVAKHLSTSRLIPTGSD
jgi:hypothetical protein